MNYNVSSVMLNCTIHVDELVVVRMQEMRYVSMNIIGDRDNFVWKGHDALPMKGGDVQFQSGFQPLCIVQMYPPAACTALTLHSGWQLYVHTDIDRNSCYRPQTNCY